MRLPDLEAWAIFATVAEHGSITAAARALALSKATVSKALARLEASLGQALFHRSSRRLTLTEAGRPLVAHARGVLAAAAAAEESARDAAQALAGRIRVAAPMSFGAANVAPLIAAFLIDHPAVEIELNLSDARVDVIAEGYDLTLRIADLPDSSLRARRLCPVAKLIVASPAYLAAHGEPRHPSELRHHRLLAYSNTPGPWRFPTPHGGEIAVEPKGPLIANSAEALLPAVLAGTGITGLPDFILAPHLATGALVPILHEWTPAPTALHLLAPPSPLRPARVEALIGFLAERLRRRD